MTLYSTTALPSLDLIGGVETLQRMLLPHTAISQVAWDKDTQTTVAVLRTEGTQLALNAIADTLARFNVPFIYSCDLLSAIQVAKELAHNEDVVEIGDYRLEDSLSL